MSDELTEFYEQVGTDADRNLAGYTQPWAAVAVGNAPTSVDSAEKRPLGPVSAWAVSGEMYWGISHSIDHIEPGCYKTGHSNSVGVYLEKMPIRTDSLIELPDSKSEAIIREITEFAQLRPAFVKRGLLYKRGVLLWGPPGSGKTSTLHLLMRLVVDRLGGVAIVVDHPALAADALRLVRRIESERQVIAIMEDIDGLIANHGVELYLSLLDGENQIDNIVFVATTNYPERLDRRLVDRPSRFDTVEYVGMPSADARRVYLTRKEPDVSPSIIEEMVEATDGLSIAHLREMIVLTQCFGRSIESAAKRLNAARHRLPHSDKSPERMLLGFAGISERP